MCLLTEIAKYPLLGLKPTVIANVRLYNRRKHIGCPGNLLPSWRRPITSLAILARDAQTDDVLLLMLQTASTFLKKGFRVSGLGFRV